jgi:hypothetical protein
MATSGEIGETFTARECIFQALQIITVYGANQTPTADDANTGLFHLQWMLKDWQADGCNLWRAEEEEFTFAANTRTIVTDPRVIDVQELRVLIPQDVSPPSADTYFRPLARWELGEYKSLPNPYVAGSPTIFYFNRKRSSTELTIWPVPAAQTTLYGTVARVIEDVTDIDQNLDVPQEWCSTITYNLASRLLDPFGISDTRPVLAQNVQARAAMLYEKLSNFDRPSAVFFKPQQVGKY